MAAALTTSAYAQSSTCSARAAEKKLGGAAKTRCLTKGDMDAHASCDASAASKKLAGAAKNSFTKKCVTDAVGK
jgi:hypothetical protein